MNHFHIILNSDFERVSDSKIFVCNLLFLGCNLFLKRETLLLEPTPQVSKIAYMRNAISHFQFVSFFSLNLFHYLVRIIGLE